MIVPPLAPPFHVHDDAWSRASTSSAHRVDLVGTTTSIIRAGATDVPRPRELGGYAGAGSQVARSVERIGSISTASKAAQRGLHGSTTHSISEPPIELKLLEAWLDNVATGNAVLVTSQVDGIVKLAQKAGDSPLVGLALAALGLGLPTHRVAELAAFVQPTENGLHAMQAMLTIACAAPRGEEEALMPGLRSAIANLRRVDFAGQAENPHLGRAIEAHLLALEALTGGDVTIGPRRVAHLLLRENAEVTGSARAADAARLLG